MTTLSKVSRMAVGLLGLALIACDAEPTTAPVAVMQFSNAAAAHACKGGGFADLQRADGTLFRNAGECTSYAAQGGTLMPIPIALPVITGFYYAGVVDCGTPEFSQTYIAYFSGGTGSVDHGVGAVPSGEVFRAGYNTLLTLTVTNAGGFVTSTIDIAPGSTVPGCGNGGGAP